MNSITKDFVPVGLRSRSRLAIMALCLGFSVHTGAQMRPETSKPSPLSSLERGLQFANEALIQSALAAGADVNARLADGDPFIIRLINDRNFGGIRRLKSLGADLEARTRAGDALVTDSAIAGDWDVVLLLLELGADPNPPGARLTLEKLLQSRTPSLDSPIYPFKVKVRERLGLGAK